MATAERRPAPPPPTEIVLTLSEKEAASMLAVLGRVRYDSSEHIASVNAALRHVGIISDPEVYREIRFSAEPFI